MSKLEERESRREIRYRWEIRGAAAHGGHQLRSAGPAEGGSGAEEAD